MSDEPGFTPLERPWARREARERRDALKRASERRTRYASRVDLHRELFAGEFNPNGYFVYTLFGWDEKPFYVGQSANILARLGSHYSTYGADIARIGVLACDNRQHMCDVEMDLIRRLRPRLNIIGVPREAS